MKKLFIAVLFAAACSTPAPSDEQLSDSQESKLYQLQPTVTRAGFLRFTDESIHDPRVARVFLDRLESGTESEGVRAALVDALPRTGGEYADAVIVLLEKERSPIVRAAYIHTARRAPGKQAIAIAQRGLGDSSPEVVAEAIRATASLPDGAKLAGSLRASLSSGDPTVRMEAARALGILRVTVAKSELDALANDASPEVRREATRAISRIDAPATTTR